MFFKSCVSCVCVVKNLVLVNMSLHKSHNQICLCQFLGFSLQKFLVFLFPAEFSTSKKFLHEFISYVFQVTIFTFFSRFFHFFLVFIRFYDINSPFAYLLEENKNLFNKSWNILNYTQCILYKLNPRTKKT